MSKNFAGSDLGVQATVRVNVGTGGKNTPKPFPFSNATQMIRTRSLVVTAAAGNAGTIYVAFNKRGFTNSNGIFVAGATFAQTISTATGRERNFIPLAAKQSFTFSGMSLGSAAPRDLVFGTGFSYIHASATPNNLAICTWYEQV